MSNHLKITKYKSTAPQRAGDSSIDKVKSNLKITKPYSEEVEVNPDNKKFN